MTPEIRLRKYEPSDFLRVRDFLAENYLKFPEPVNWDMVRWNYSRYFIAPMIGAWGIGEVDEKIPDATGKRSMESIRFWESSIGVWKTEDGEIAGVVCPEEYAPWHNAFGRAYLQRCPDCDHLLPEMLEYAERTFRGTRNTRNTRNTPDSPDTLDTRNTRIYVAEHDMALNEAAEARGFVRDEEPCIDYMEYDLADIPETTLPPGYRFVSMAENNDIEKRRKVFGLSFWHPDPNDWPTAYSYEEFQKAPDYRKELDLVIERPDGEWVACTVAWFDEYNGVGTLEHVGAVQLGMGREVVLEGLRRLRDLGARTAHMDSDLRFYKKAGFKKRFSIYRWVKTHNYR